MRVLLDNRDGVVHVSEFYPHGGPIYKGLKVEPGEVVLLDVRPGEVSELQRERREDA